MTLSIAPYSDAWPEDFATVRRELLGAFGGDAPRIEHIGSTSVPGLCAKPVIDVLLGADSLARIEAAIPGLAAAGYDYVNKYESVIPERRYFVKPEGEGPRVHVHGVREGSAIWVAHLAFRDALRADADLRDTYARLKLDLARVHGNDKASYTEAKGPFIQRVLASVAARANDGGAPGGLR